MPALRRVGKYEWIDALNRAFDQGLEPTFTPTTRAVALELFTFMGPFGDRCFPSVKTLAERMGRKQETVVKHRNRLEARGYLEIRRGGGRGRSSHYYAGVPVTVTAADQTPSAPEPPELLEAGGGVVPDAEHDVLVTAAGVELVPAGDVQEPAAAPGPAGDGALVDVDQGEPAEPPPQGGGNISTSPGGNPPCPERGTTGRAHARKQARRSWQDSQREPAAADTGLQLCCRYPAELLAAALAVVAALHLPGPMRGWLGRWGRAVEEIAAALQASGAAPAELARAIEEAVPGSPLGAADKPGWALLWRLPLAVELVGQRRAADQHAAELGAGGSDWRVIAASPQPARSQTTRQAVAAELAALRQRRGLDADAQVTGRWRGVFSGRTGQAPGSFAAVEARLKARYLSA